MTVLYRYIVAADLDTADCVTAELVKTTENAYRDVQIAFANEVAQICAAVGGDVWRVRELVNKSPGRNMHFPGAGVGGHCIPKDGWLLIANAPETVSVQLIPQARAINDSMPRYMAALTLDGLAQAGVAAAEAKIALFGYAYLENSDDTRNTPSAAYVEALQTAVADIRIHDPYVAPYQGEWQEIARDADAAIFLVAHDQYRAIDLAQLRRLLRTPILIDGRRLFDPDTVKTAGFIARCVGVAS